MVTLEEILEAIPQLSAEDVSRIKSTAGAHIFLTNNTKAKITKYNPMIEDLLILACKRYVTVRGNVSIIKKINAFKMGDKIRDICEDIHDFSKEYNLSKKSSIKLIYVLVEIAASIVIERSSSPTLPHLLNQMGDIRSLLDHAYPGYVGSKIFKKVVLQGD